ncbi:hypothetical protein [Aquimarina megaterium]|uniref:hypothetical protein n=1 Tax=Aquimarina megaterium TaxID=1443666 RepID=UPI0019D3F2A8|nr:hypothetical protein [Aquimarina megaterium]
MTLVEIKYKETDFMKNKSVLNILIICFIFLNLNAISQERNGVDNMYKKELENHIWETDKTVLLDNDGEYILTKFVERKFAGNLLSFNNQQNLFGSDYKSFCGNDRRISIQGEYEFYDKDKISFIISTQDTKSPDGLLMHEEIVGDKILFKIIKKGEKFVLRKIEE